jgi:hypothetical protein
MKGIKDKTPESLIDSKYFGAYFNTKTTFWYNCLKYLISVGFITTVTKKKLLSITNNGRKWMNQENPKLTINVSYSRGNDDNEIKEVAPDAGIKPKSHIITGGLFQEGKTIENIALIRGLKCVTIEGHLSKCIQEGFIESNDFDRLGFNVDDHGIIIKTINDDPINGDTSKLKIIKDNCPDHITYLQIVCSLALMYKY